MAETNPEILQLQRMYHWEKSRPNDLHMTQPMTGGALRTFTYKETMDQVRRMATHLKSMEFPPGSHIAILSKNCAWWIMADLAIWMAGHVSVPLYPTLAEDTVQYILEHSESKLLFVGKLDTWAVMKPGVSEELPCISFPYPLDPATDYPTWDDIMAESEPLTENPTKEPDELATIVYTSGSTGRPKGVMLNFGGMCTSAQGLGPELNISPKDRMLSYLPLAHVMERWLVETGSIVFGFQLFFAEKLETFLKDLQRAEPTLFVSVPRLWLKFQQGIHAKMPPKKLNLLLKIPILNRIIKKKILTKLGLQHVRFAGSGSAPIPPELIQWYQKLGLELLEGYGMSENFCYSHMSRPGNARLGYVGNAYPEVDCRISEDGEIQIKSPGNMAGYYKAPEKTKETFTEDGYLKTGDRGAIDEQGRLRITGRVKELFKTSKGKYVAPAPIENKLLVHEDVELCCVSGSGYPGPHGVVQLSPEARKRVDNGVRDELAKSLADHIARVNKALDPHERLKFVAVVKDEWTVEDGYLTPTMKIKRSRIEDQYQPHVDKWYEAKQKVVFQD